MASIGEQIREARKTKGLTQDALAEALNVSRSTVANWESEYNTDAVLGLRHPLCK